MKVLAVLFLSFCLLLSGCWNRVEVNDLAIESMLGVDLAGGGQIRTTSQIVIPSLLTGRANGQNSDGGRAYFVVSQEGRDLLDCIGKMQEELSRQFMVGHRRVVIFGEKLARAGIQKIIDELTRNPEGRLNTYILIADHSNADKLMNIPDYLEKVPAEAVREIERSHTGLAIQLKDFLLMCASEENTAVAGAIRATQKGFELSGVAVFRDFKLIDYLNDEQARALLWLRNDVDRGAITIELPGTDQKISIRILHAQTKYKPSMRNGHIHMDVNIRAEGNVSENNSNLDLTNPHLLEKVEREVTDSIRARIMETVEHAQKDFKADIFGFGTIVYRNMPAEWERLKSKWNEEFPRTEVDLHIALNIHRIGMSGPGLELKEEEIQK
jgi:spore germination protein KC